MHFFLLLIFCNLLSSGYLQETKNVDDYNFLHPIDVQNSGGDWPLQTVHTIEGKFYGQAQRNLVPKPCSRRSNSESEPIDQQIKPPFTTKTKPLLNQDTTTLKPHSLRSGDYDSKTSEKLVNDVNNLGHITPMTVTNPVIDSMEEHHREIIPSNDRTILEDIKPTTQLRSRSENSVQSLSVPTKKFFSSPDKKSQSTPVSVFRYVPTNEYGIEPENQYLYAPSNVIGSEHNEFRTSSNKKTNVIKTTNTRTSPINNAISISSSDLFPELATDLHPASNLDQKTSVSSEAETSTLPNKCSHVKEPNILIGHSRRSMSNGNDDDNTKDNLEHDKELKIDGYIESHIDNENAMASVLNTEKNTGRNKDHRKKLDKSKSNEMTVARKGRPQFNDARREMIEPTKGAGITNMGETSLMLMQTERICYACSTANNPTCWAPDRRTTVKYCRKGNNACITKTFGSGSTFTLIRDCGKTCDDSDASTVMPRYKTCSICHTELCNGAYSINGHSIIFALILISIVKYLN